MPMGTEEEGKDCVVEYEYESDGVKTEGKRIERGREPVADLDNLGAPIIMKKT